MEVMSGTNEIIFCQHAPPHGAQWHVIWGSHCFDDTVYDPIIVDWSDEDKSPKRGKRVSIFPSAVIVLCR